MKSNTHPTDPEYALQFCESHGTMTNHLNGICQKRPDPTSPDPKPDTLREALDAIIIYGGEDGDMEWTLGEVEDEASWTIREIITGHLKKLKKPIAKKLVFGDTQPVENALYNSVIDELIMDIEEGKLK